MAEVLATFAVEQILEKVISLAAQEITLIWGLKQDLKKLGDSLLFIQALLHDAGEKQIANRAIQIWMQKLQDLAYEAEDVLDEFGYELLRSQLKKVRSFFSYQNPILFRFKMAHNLKKINEKLEKIRSESSGLGLVPISYVENKIEVTDSYLHKSEVVVGRNEEVSTILKKITHSSESICVIPIVGMAGLGKTTLARVLSKKVEEDKLFDETMWMCVSNTFDEEKILRAMLQSIDSTVGGIDHIDATLKHLRQKLKDKSFFLVLDDVWNEDERKWKSLMNRLLKINESMKNCIVITTRSEGVASITQTNPTHSYSPTKLSDDECWSIIKDKVFGKDFEEIPQDLKDIGRDIAAKCAGLPLLAQILGGTMKTSADWSSIKDSTEWSALTKNNEILPVLKLSFDRLPLPSLKQCFAYCAIFPEDYVIEKSKLIQLWIAQGYVLQERNTTVDDVQQKENISVDDVGENYFKILLANSLFQDVVKDKLENIISCKMHDAVHGLAKFVSRSEIWISNSMSMNMTNIRHIRLKSGEILTKLEKNSSRKIRSLFSDVKVHINNSTLQKGLKRMRALCIHGSSTTHLSTTFVAKKHLRYLDISESTISIQPQWIAKLYNLQTFRFVNYRGRSNPLPEVKHLINLKHIIFNNPNLVPSHVGKLICLQTLSIFVVETKKGHGIEELGSLKHLRGELKLQKLENVKGKSNADEADMQGKPKLQKLTYLWSKSYRQEGNDEKDVLEGLKPHRDLVQLEIRNFGGESFSSWLSDHDLLGRLRRLTLFDCENCIALPTLGEMSSLEYLAIENSKNVKRIGIEFYKRVDLAGAVNGGVTLFPALIELNMHGMPKLEEWVAPIEDGIIIFPSLEILRIQFCENLTRIPVIQSESLRKLDIRFCKNLSNLEGVNGSGGLVDLKIVNSGISILPTFSNSLQNIYLCRLPNLTIIPENIGDSACLVEFEIMNCKALTNMPTRLRSCVSLKTLSIRNCKKLENVPENLGEMSSLESLHLDGGYGLRSIPNLQHCTHLKQLRVESFDELQVFPEWLGNFSSLESLAINNYKSLKCLPESMGDLSSLVELRIEKCKSLKSLPESMGNLPSLVRLYISGCKTLRSLPESMGDISSLVKLEIWLCDILGSLPESMRRLTNIKELTVYYCPILVGKLKSREDYSEYLKIAHIESIMIEM